MSKNKKPCVKLVRQALQLRVPKIQIHSDSRMPEDLKQPRYYSPLVENHIYKYMWDKHENEESYAMEAKYCDWCDDDYSNAEIFFQENYRFEFSKKQPSEGLELMFMQGYLSCKQLYQLRKLCREMEIVWESLSHELLRLYISAGMHENLFYLMEVGSSLLRSNEFFDDSKVRNTLERAVKLLQTQTGTYLSRWRNLVFELFNDKQRYVRDFLMAYFAPVDYAFIGTRSVNYWDMPLQSLPPYARLSESDIQFLSDNKTHFLVIKNCHL